MANKHDIKVIVLQYVTDPDHSLHSLNKYLMNKIIFRYNPPSPSTALAVRLFSFAGHGNSTKKSDLTGEMFENITERKLILCVNLIPR